MAIEPGRFRSGVMQDGWYYSSLGETMGPVSFETIVELARDGLLSPSDQVRLGTDGEWAPADSIVGLAFGAESADQEMEVATDLSDLDIKFGDSTGTKAPARSGATARAGASTRAAAPAVGSPSTPRPGTGAGSPPRRTGSAPPTDETQVDADFSISDTLLKAPTLRSAAPPKPAVSPTPSKLPSSGPTGGRAGAKPGAPSPSVQRNAGAAKHGATKKVVPGSPEVDEGDSWYGRALGVEFGPMPFAELVLMAANGVLGADDQVRPGPDGPWLGANEVSEVAEAITMWQLTGETGALSESKTPPPPSKRAAGAAAPGPSPAAVPRSSGAPASPAGNGLATGPGVPPGAAHMSGHGAGFTGHAGPPGAGVMPGSPQIVTVNGQNFMQVAVRGPDGQVRTVLAPIQGPSVMPPTHMGGPPLVIPVVTQVVTTTAAPASGSAKPESTEADDDDDSVEAREEEARRKDRRDSEKWYCQTNGEEHGPLEFRYLRRTAVAGKLGRDDLVRRGKKGPWVAAHTIPELFDAEAESGVKVDLEKLVGEARSGDAPQKDVGSKGAGESGPSKDVDKLIRSAQLNAMRAKPVVVEERESPITRLIEKVKENKVASGVALGAVLLMVWLFGAGSARDRAMVEQVVKIYGEFCKLRDKKAPESEWATFETKSKAELDALMKQLDPKKISPQTAKAFVREAIKEFELVIKYGRKEPLDVERSFVGRLNRARLTFDPKAQRIVAPGAQDAASAATPGGAPGPTPGTPPPGAPPSP